VQFLKDSDFAKLGKWGFDEGRLIVSHFQPLVEHICDEMNRFSFFDKVSHIRQSSHDNVWEIGNPNFDEFDELESYQFFHPWNKHWYLYNYGGAGEIQFNVGMFADQKNPDWNFVRIGIGFSFGGSFIPDEGTQGENKTPCFYSTFKMLLENDAPFRKSFSKMLNEHGMICESCEDLETADSIIEYAMSLNESQLPGSDNEWVSFMHILYWDEDEDKADLMDMDRFIKNRCKPVFKSCYPIWEKVQIETRKTYRGLL
jgi:hypothetical protein